jgi:ABC-type transporter Mla subunit MlaD
LFRELSKNISEAIHRIATVDFKRISNEVETTLNSVNRYLNDPKISTLIDRLDQISVNLEKTSRGISDSITKENIDRVIGQMETSMQAFDELAKDVRQQIKAAEIDQAVKEMRLTLKAAVQLRNEISETLDSITEFVQYMSEDPGSVIRGKQQPPIEFTNPK